MGAPAVAGLTLGVLIGNVNSPLGPIDLLSFLPSFLGLMIVHKTRGRMVVAGLAAYSLLLSVWVAFMLNVVFGLPYFLTFLYVLGGMVISTVGLGYLVYVGTDKAIKSWSRR